MSGVDLADDPPISAALPAQAPRRRIGDYELIEEIARGGMGVVYRARQASLNRLVAVKILLSSHGSADAQRFRREAQLAASLDHPNIVSIHEVGDDHGQPYFSMPLIEGQSLAELTRENPLPPTRAARLVKTIAEAIHYAHERGLLHRDLKPSNVIVDAHDTPHVTDFGLARYLEGSDALTVTGQVLGTPSYMPPEQAEPQRAAASAASDVYSLGAILYHLLTGRPPFMAESLTQTLRLVTDTEPVLATLLNPRVPRDLATICTKCLEKNPDRRYASAQELAEELGRFLRKEPIKARPVSPAARLLRWARRKPAVALPAAAAAALFLVVAIGSPIAIVEIDRERKNAESARQQEILLRQRAELAEKGSRQQLYVALLEQARATVRSGEIGQRVRALDALKRAAAISNTVELRREALAALMLPDLRPERTLPISSRYTLREPDPGLERIALSRGRAVEIRSLIDQRLFITLPASTNLPVHDAKWSDNGEYLAIKRDLPPDGSWANWEVWEVASGRRALLLHDIPLAAIAFHPHLPQVIVGQKSGDVVMHSLNGDEDHASKNIAFAVPRMETPYLLRYAPAGDRFAASRYIKAGWTITIHDSRTGTLLISNHFAAYPRDFQWHPTGNWLAVPDDSGAVRMMDARTGTVKSLGTHRAAAAMVAFSSDGDWLISGGWDRELICWDARAMRRAFIIDLTTFRARFRSDGRMCAVINDNEIRLLHFEAPSVYRELTENVGVRLRHAAFSPDGRWLAVSGDKAAAVWDLQSGGPGAVDSAAGETWFYFRHDEPEVLGARNRSGVGEAFRWRLEPGSDSRHPPAMLREPLHSPPGITSLAIASNTLVLTATNGSQILALGECDKRALDWSPTPSGVTAISADGRWLAIYRPFSTSVSIYSLPSLERATRLEHPTEIRGAVFSGNAPELAIYSAGLVELWNSDTWNRTRTLTNFSRITYAAAEPFVWLERELRFTGLYSRRSLEPAVLLPPGMLLLAASDNGRHVVFKVDGRLQLWDWAEARKQLRELGLDWGREPTSVASAR